MSLTIAAKRAVAAALAVAVLVVLSGCSDSEKPEVKKSAPEATKAAPQATPTPDKATSEPAGTKETETKEAPAEPPTESAMKPKDEGATPKDEADKSKEAAAPASKEAPATTPPAKPDATKDSEDRPAPAAKVADLGAPLVDDEKSLKRLDPDSPVWVDSDHKQVIFLGQTCHADYPLEFLVTLRDRSYESVLATDVRPRLVHAGLLAVGAVPGHPAKFDTKFTPPTGTEVAIELRWKDKDGKVQHAKAQEWIRNVTTKKPLDVNWVFVGSALRTNPVTHKEEYLADGGDFIDVLNLPDSTLDLPVQSSSALESRLFEGSVEHVPPAGTPVTIILKPKLAK